MKYGDGTSAEVEQVAAGIVQAAFTVHTALGPGLLEGVYEVCLAHELCKQGFDLQRQVVVPVTYDAITLDAGLRLDLVVNGLVIVEIKAVEKLIPVHQAQLLTYLKLTGYTLGLLINFNVPLIKEGIRRVVLSKRSAIRDDPFNT